MYESNKVADVAGQCVGSRRCLGEVIRNSEAIAAVSFVRRRHMAPRETLRATPSIHATSQHRPAFGGYEWPLRSFGKLSEVQLNLHNVQCLPRIQMAAMFGGNNTSPSEIHQDSFNHNMRTERGKTLCQDVPCDAMPRRLLRAAVIFLQASICQQGFVCSRGGAWTAIRGGSSWQNNEGGLHGFIFRRPLFA